MSLEKEKIYAEICKTKKKIRFFGFVGKIFNTEKKIEDLNRRLKALKKEIVHSSDDEDRRYILEHWKMLVGMHRSNHLASRGRGVIISCFPLYSRRSEYGVFEKSNVKLVNLLELWEDGFTFRGKPVVSVEKRYSETFVGFINDDHVIETVSGVNVNAYCAMLSELPPCPEWSRLSVVGNMYAERKF